MMRTESHFFEAMQLFKAVSHASCYEQWVLIHLGKEDLGKEHPPLYGFTEHRKYFVEKIRSMGCAEEIVERLTRI